jgi:putative flippase GtrA
MISTLRTGFRFAVVGILNTAIGYTAIIAALFAGLTDIAANAFGYVVGLCISFFVNRQWTFDVSSPVNSGEVFRFLGLFAFSWSLNISVVAIGIYLGFAGNPLLHLAGIVAYSLSFFLLSDAIVYRPNAAVLNWKKWAPELSVLIVALFTFGLLRNIALTHDVVWQLWIAKQMINGVSLYGQIFEINPPLWFWMALPVQWIANLTGSAAGSVLVGCITLLAFISAILTSYLSDMTSAVQRISLMLLTFLLVMFGFLYDFGQREQIALATTIPYVFLIVRRASEKQVPIMLAILVGLLAAFGFALKHYFVAIPILLELFLLSNLKMKYRPFRTETHLVGFMAVIYAVLIVLITPDFLTIVVPMVQLAYFGYEVPPALWFDEPIQVLWVLSVAALIASGRYRGPNRNLYMQAFMCAAVGFLFAYLVQRKGWQYHAIPVSGMLVMALASVALTRTATLRDLWRSPFSAFVIVCYFLLAQLQGTYVSSREEKYTKLFQSTPEGSAIMVVSSNPMWIWPTIENTDRVWPSRYFAHWMLPAIGHHRHVKNLGPAFDKLAQQILVETDHDIRCTPPALIIVERGEPGYTVRPKQFDTLSYIRENPRLANYLSTNYVERGTNKWLRIFRRITPLETVRVSGCRTIY